MTKDELELKKFKFEQEIKLEEIDLKKKEFELNLQQVKSKRIFAPILLTIAGGLITLITGLILNYFESKAALDLEDIKSQSNLILKAAESKNYEDFVNLLFVFEASDFIQLDSSVVESFKSHRKLSEFKERQSKLYYETTSIVSFLTVNVDFEKPIYKEKLSRFWELYWVELSTVETSEVETAMVRFGNIIKQLERNKFKNISNLQDELKAKGYEVAQAIKSSIKETTANNVYN
jgi:hypothetical protein